MRSFTVLTIFIALAITGCALMPLLPVKLVPSETLPSLTVKFSMRGNSARTVEAEVTSRLESVLARVKGVKDIESKSRAGSGQVSVSFDRHADMDHTRFEVSTLVRQVWGDMPEGVSYPSISMRQADKEGARPFMTLTLNAPAEPGVIMAYGEKNLKPLLARIPGVGKVEISGAQPAEWRLLYDTDRLATLGLTPSDLRSAILQHYDTEFLGMTEVETDGKREWLRLTLRSAGAEGGFDAARITVATPSGKAVPIDKLVSAVHGEADPSGYFRINGLNSVYVSISADAEANQLDVAEGVRDVIRGFRDAMPAGYSVTTSYDATEGIHEELDKIYFRSGLTVLILLLFVGLATFSVRYVLLIAIGLTINLAVAVLLYYFSGVEIQIYSLAGITISLNLIIDNLIVMTDHYMRRHDRKAFTAILAATLTTAGALSVVFFMDEKTRLSMQDFVAVVIINLAVSLAVALWLVPALVERLGMDKRGKRAVKGRRLRRRAALILSNAYAGTVGFIVRFRVAAIILVVLAFGLPVFLIPERLEGGEAWKEKYNKVFGSASYKENVKPWVESVLGGTLRLFVEKVYNGSYWDRDPGEPVLGINASLPNGATLEQMNSLVKKMEQYLAGFPEIRQFQTSISGPGRASISVFFVKEHQRDGFPYRLKSEVVSKALTLGGGSWTVYGLDDMGFSNDVRENAGNYRVKLTGYNYDQLYAWAERTRDTLLSHRRIKEVTIASEFSYWKEDYSEYRLEVDRTLLAKHGLDVGRLFAAIEPTFGRAVSTATVAGENGSERICLYSRQGADYDIFTLMRQPFRVGSKTVVLSDVATLEKRLAPPDIVKRNQEYVLCLQYEYIGSDKQGDRVLGEDLAKINSLMPVGYRAESESRRWQRDEDKGKYWLLLLVAVIIFFTTSILFNSLRQPFAIIFIIPVSFIGVFSVFYLFRLNFDQGGFASFILLAGITVNAAIYILSELNSLRRRHPRASVRRLYIRAVRVKIVPILLTVLSTILGFIPFVVGESRESFWFPLAVGTMGGLAMSLIAILFIFPVFVVGKRSGRGANHRRKGSR